MLHLVNPNLGAAIREVKEELKLQIEPKSLRMLHKFPHIGDELAYFRTVYIYESNEIPNYSRNDFSGFEWLAPNELYERLKNNEPAKRSLTETVKFLIKNPV